jgi:hypothetical protein
MIRKNIALQKNALETASIFIQPTGRRITSGPGRLAERHSASSKSSTVTLSRGLDRARVAA